MKKYSIILACSIVTGMLAQPQPSDNGGQWLQPITPKFSQSTEMKSLQDVTEAGVDYATGTAMVNLPLYTVQHGPLSFDVKLMYDASGIKVDQEASWVGLGWLLSPGATITRDPLGKPDELYYSNTANNPWITTWNGYCAGVMGLPTNVPTYNSGSFSYFVKNSARLLTSCGSFQGPVSDMQPDLYSLNIGGTKIDFVMDLNGNPFVLNNNNDYQITKNGNSFTIIDEAGTKYFFASTDVEKTEIDVATTTSYNSSVLPANTYHNTGWYLLQDAQDYGGCTNISMFGQTECIIKWNLTKVESPDGKYAINFEYDDYKYGQMSASYVYNISENTLGLYTYQYIDNYPGSPANVNHGTYLQECSNGYAAKRLNKITWGSGYLTFEANTLRSDVITSIYPYAGSTDSRSLDYIKLFDSNGTELKRFALNYDYFTATTALTGDDAYRSKRLKLQSVTEYGSDLVTAKPPYTFDYDSKQLPVRLSFEKDFWGYYRNNSATNLCGKNYLYANYSNTDLADFKLWSQFCIYPITLSGSGSPVTISGADRMPNLADTSLAKYRA